MVECLAPGALKPSPFVKYKANTPDCGRIKIRKAQRIDDVVCSCRNKGKIIHK
jgi:hypothetical protein